MKLTILFHFIPSLLFEAAKLQQLHIVQLYCKGETPLGINPLSLYIFVMVCLIMAIRPNGVAWLRKKRVLLQ